MSTTAQAILNSTKQSNLADRVTNFILRYGYNLYSAMDRDIVRELFEKHAQYGTFLIVWNKSNIVAIGRWNWISHNSIRVLDLIIHPDYRKKQVMKSMLIQVLTQYPWITHMSFHRKKHKRDVNCLVKDFIGGKYGRK